PQRPVSDSRRKRSYRLRSHRFPGIGSLPSVPATGSAPPLPWLLPLGFLPHGCPPPDLLRGRCFLPLRHFSDNGTDSSPGKPATDYQENGVPAGHTDTPASGFLSLPAWPVL